MNDAGIGRHYAEVVEGGLRPAQESIALPIPLKFEQRVIPNASGDPNWST